MTRQTRPPLIELADATCRIGRKTILDGISLTVGQGEFVGILGPNGAGKSTLLALMGGRLRPSSGTVRFNGTDVWATGERQRAALRTRIGTVLQQSEYNPMIPMTAREVVEMGRLGHLGPMGRFTAADQVFIDEAMARLGVAHLAGQTYRSLSGGEQQKVQIARALAQQPDLLMLDEPTSGLDMDWQERLVALASHIYEAEAPGSGPRPIIMTTHMTGHLPHVCRRVLLIKQGRLVFDGPAAEALTETRLGDLYGCRVEVTGRGGRRHCHGVGGAAR